MSITCFTICCLAFRFDSSYAFSREGVSAPLPPIQLRSLIAVFIDPVDDPTTERQYSSDFEFTSEAIFCEEMDEDFAGEVFENFAHGNSQLCLRNIFARD